MVTRYSRFVFLCAPAICKGLSYYGGPDLTCEWCGAFYWFREGSKYHANASVRWPIYTGCCRGGKVSLPKFRDWPSPLDSLMPFDGEASSTRFMRLIRQYNSMFCFTSLGTYIDHNINVSGAQYVFKMKGVVYQRIGPLLPAENFSPKFAQLYMVD